MEISVIKGNEKIPFWSQVTKTGTESYAEKNCDDRQRYRLQLGQFRKSTVRNSKFPCETMQDKSNINFQVMFYIDEDFNNPRKWKNTILE